MKLALTLAALLALAAHPARYTRYDMQCHYGKIDWTHPNDVVNLVAKQSSASSAIISFNEYDDPPNTSKLVHKVYSNTPKSVTFAKSGSGFTVTFSGPGTITEAATKTVTPTSVEVTAFDNKAKPPKGHLTVTCKDAKGNVTWGPAAGPLTYNQITTVILTR